MAQRPGRPLAERNQWQHKIDIATGEERGVIDPDGGHHKLLAEEQFIINRGEKDDYEAVIKGPNGSRVLRSFERSNEDTAELASVRAGLSMDDKDERYAAQFWEHQQSLSNKPQFLEDVRRTMEENIVSAAQDGFIGSFVDMKGMNEKDKAKLSAYRQLAEEMGYEVGQYMFNKQTGVARAPIKKKV